MKTSCRATPPDGLRLEEDVVRRVADGLPGSHVVRGAGLPGRDAAHGVHALDVSDAVERSATDRGRSLDELERDRALAPRRHRELLAGDLAAFAVLPRRSAVILADDLARLVLEL